MNLTEIAKDLRAKEENILLVYAFNATGKTRLSVEYKNITKRTDDSSHAGVYYNAFSEDLFVWDNDTENGEQEIKLDLRPCTLNKFHSLLTEESVRQKLIPFKHKYHFEFNVTNAEQGIDSISFYSNTEKEQLIKISRGEERIFILCFFLALFDVEGWSDIQNEHFFIDDPVSSLDDHNIFITAAAIYDLIETQYNKSRKIIITTHHIGLFSILADWLTRGEKSDRYAKLTGVYKLNRIGDELILTQPKGQVFLYHLHLLQVLDTANKEQLYNYHFALLRQLLENISSFLGAGHFSYVLKQIGIQETGEVTRIITSLSHKTVYYFQTEVMNEDNMTLFKRIFEPLMAKYQFKI